MQPTPLKSEGHGEGVSDQNCYSFATVGCSPHLHLLAGSAQRCQSESACTGLFEWRSQRSASWPVTPRLTCWWRGVGRVSARVCMAHDESLLLNPTGLQGASACVLCLRKVPHCGLHTRAREWSTVCGRDEVTNLYSQLMMALSCFPWLRLPTCLGPYTTAIALVLPCS